ncbi:MAG TPA: phosphodiester glycosidase family protein [Armatimonadota bacterium]|nr:phosphodiester glycosidase family protein [Armatimonadota bacterium]
MIGFEANNTPHMASVRYNLFGSIAHNNGYPLRWYAYWMNRKPTATPCVTMFTRQWGAAVDPMGGTSVVIEDGAIDAITNQRVAIPEHGYVVHFRGEDSLLARFHVGDRITFAPEMTVNGDDPAAWGNVTEAVGAGPRVLTHGTPVFTPAAEGFSDQKILQLSGARSAAGYTSDGVLYLITTRGARVSDLGHILKALGCVEGMNLDGGASSGLWYRGSYLTTPGRQISNALLVVERK